MDYVRITHIDDPLFAEMHQLMGRIFPAEEVLKFELWREPLEDPGIRVFVAVHEGSVVGATEYRYYEDDNVAMTDFTIIGEPGLGIGPFLAQHRQQDPHEAGAGRIERNLMSGNWRPSRPMRCCSVGFATSQRRRRS